MPSLVSEIDQLIENINKVTDCLRSNSVPFNKDELIDINEKLVSILEKIIKPVKDLAYNNVVKLRGSPDAPGFDACVENEIENLLSLTSDGWYKKIYLLSTEIKKNSHAEIMNDYYCLLSAIKTVIPEIQATGLLNNS